LKRWDYRVVTGIGATEETRKIGGKETLGTVLWSRRIEGTVGREERAAPNREREKKIRFNEENSGTRPTKQGRMGHKYRGGWISP